jgi:hypothetical protein
VLATEAGGRRAAYHDDVIKQRHPSNGRARTTLCSLLSLETRLRCVLPLSLKSVIFSFVFRGDLYRRDGDVCRLVQVIDGAGP